MARTIESNPEVLHITVVTRTSRHTGTKWVRRYGPFTRKNDATAAFTRAKHGYNGHGYQDMYDFSVEYLTTTCDWKPAE